ncbi:Hypothetical predicted protein [Mytilus galloprovincialis]|uniref:Uncharacterized protein n=1 Tax=Mytilus galloprovincialis TaxID=29158 RepID=A0A8B6CHQ1_MYTGA|nr:Hypothetical predicted protein [Mytilus galloprovincialis]
MDQRMEVHAKATDNYPDDVPDTRALFSCKYNEHWVPNHCVPILPIDNIIIENNGCEEFKDEEREVLNEEKSEDKSKNQQNSIRTESENEVTNKEEFENQQEQEGKPQKYLHVYDEILTGEDNIMERFRKHFANLTVPIRDEPFKYKYEDKIKYETDKISDLTYNSDIKEATKCAISNL